MSWFNRNSRKRKSTILKRRGPSAERLILWAKRSGLTIAAIVFVGWLGAWFFMSDANERLAQWGQNKVLQISSGYGFQVKNILVEGRYYTDADALKAIINVRKNDPLFLFEPAPAQAMIEKLSWVKSVKVERRLPDTIYVHLEERQPMALWQRQKRLSLIDTHGVVLTDHKLARFKDYIILVGKEVPERAPDFLKLLAAEPEIYNRVEAATIISNRRWDLKLKNGTLVKLPENETTLALRRLAVMQDEEQLMDKNVKAIDVRDHSRITVRTQPGAVQEYKTGYQKTNI